MTSSEYQVARVFGGDELLRAWREIGAQRFGLDQWPAAVELGRYDVIIARLAQRAIGTVTIRWEGPNSDSDPELVRVIGAIYPSKESGATPAVYSLEVHKDYRRLGAGRSLMEAVHRRIATKPETQRRAALSVAVNNPAKKLYESMGYEPVTYDGQSEFSINVPVFDPSGSYREVMALSYLMVKDLRN